MKKYDAIIAFVLDRSGSMMGLTDSVILHFNKYKKEMQALPQDIAMSVFLFDDQYERLHVNKSVEDVPALTAHDYYARGSTALLDAIGRTINSVARLKNLPEKVVIVINTDGMENSSHEFTKSQIKGLIEKYTEKGWQFVFAGANFDAFSEGASMGFSNRSSFTMSSTARGVSDYYDTLTLSSSNYIAGASQTVDLAEAAEILQIEDGNPDKKKKVTK